jgi:AcrR family transcriptional regulator
MSESVKPRRYRSSVREEQARRTRLAILDAARLLFTKQGYAATTIAQIAAAARVAVDTVYASVGTKPVLMRLLVETTISGEDQPIPAEERDYVRRIRAVGAAVAKIRLYADAVTAVNSRLASLHLSTVRRRRAGAGTRSDVDRDRHPAGQEHAPVRTGPGGHR